MRALIEYSERHLFGSAVSRELEVLDGADYGACADSGDGLFSWQEWTAEQRAGRGDGRRKRVSAEAADAIRRRDRRRSP